MDERTCSSEIQTLRLLILLSLDQVRFVQISIEIVAGEILETLVSSSRGFRASIARQAAASFVF